MIRTVDYYLTDTSRIWDAFHTKVPIKRAHLWYGSKRLLNRIAQALKDAESGPGQISYSLKKRKRKKRKRKERKKEKKKNFKKKQEFW